MKIGKFLLISVLLLLTASLSFTQERSKAADLLHYFPQLPYIHISQYYKIRDLPDSEALRMFKHYQDLEQATFASEPPAGSIPKRFSENLISSTVATVEKRERQTIMATLPKTPEEKRQFEDNLRKKYHGYSGYYPTKGPAHEGEQEITINIKRHEHISVGYYEGSHPLFEQSLEQGELTVWNEKIEGHAVYAVNNPGLDDDPGGPFLLPLSSRVVLLAGRFEHLRKMLFAGNGKLPRMMDDPLFSDLRKLIPPKDFDWTATFHFGGSYEYLLDLKSTGAPVDKLKSAQEAMNNHLYTFRITELGENIVAKEISVCKDEPSAKIQFRSIQAADRRPLDPRNHELYMRYKQYERDHKKYEQAGNWVIETFVQDETFLKMKQAYYASINGRRETL